MGCPFLPLDKERKLSGCSICFLAAEITVPAAAADPNPRNNVSEARETHKPKTKL